MTDLNEKIRVLIVDDEERFRTTLLKILTAKGIQATAASGGAAALAELDRCAYDVVLLDVKMPGMDGIEVLKTLRERGCPAEVIILSGHAAIDTAMATSKGWWWWCGAFHVPAEALRHRSSSLDKIYAAHDRKVGAALH